MFIAGVRLAEDKGPINHRNISCECRCSAAGTTIHIHLPDFYLKYQLGRMKSPLDNDRLPRIKSSPFIRTAMANLEIYVYIVQFKTFS